MRDHKHRNLVAEQTAAFGEIFADRGRNVFGLEGIGEIRFEIAKRLVGAAGNADRIMRGSTEFFSVVGNTNISFLLSNINILKYFRKVN